MRIGYPCINRTIDCTASSTFRLKSYTESRVKQKVKNNLECLRRILQFNLEHKLFFFRISSDLVPFASHPINRFNWQKYFQEDFELLLKQTDPFDFDIMLEIKDKEKSAIKAIDLSITDWRVQNFLSNNSDPLVF